jgi:hypothetical protein
LAKIDYLCGRNILLTNNTYYEGKKKNTDDSPFIARFYCGAGTEKEF